MTDEIRTCADCGVPFTLTPGAQAFFESRHLDLPRRCGRCRGNTRYFELAEAVRAEDWELARQIVERHGSLRSGRERRSSAVSRAYQQAE